MPPHHVTRSSLCCSPSLAALFLAAAKKFQQNRKKNSATATTTAVCQSQSAVLRSIALLSRPAVLVSANYRLDGMVLSGAIDQSIKEATAKKSFKIWTLTSCCCKIVTNFSIKSRLWLYFAYLFVDCCFSVCVYIADFRSVVLLLLRLNFTLHFGNKKNGKHFSIVFALHLR